MMKIAVDIPNGHQATNNNNDNNNNILYHFSARKMRNMKNK